MTIPFYHGFNHPGVYPKDQDFHAGLWYDRFFNEYIDANGKVKDGGKLEWINKLAPHSFRGIKIGQFAMRHMSLIEALRGKSLVAKTDWHFVTGMGINHPVENGFAWHPTLGVPYLTGAAVKGMLRASCEIWSDTFEPDSSKKDAKLREWFGPSAKDLEDKNNKPFAGNLIFFDALPIKSVKLQADVTTPHYRDWYKDGDKAPADNGANVPADWHSPVPVPFLAVASGQQFLFSIAARPGRQANLQDVLGELKKALEWIGAGAKTAAGYGHMTNDPAALKSIEDKFSRYKETQLKITKEAQKKAEIEKLPPFEKSIAELLAAKEDKNMKDYVLLYQKMVDKHWTEADDKTKVALLIKKLMQEAKAWKEGITVKKPDSDKDYQRTLKVMEYLRVAK